MEVGYGAFCNKHTQYWTHNTLSRTVFVEILCHFSVGAKGRGVRNISEKELKGLEGIQK